MAQDGTGGFPRKMRDEDVVQINVPENNGIPNNPRLAALIYPKALTDGFSIEDVMALYEQNRWFHVWAYTVFDYHHFHHAVHEVLTVAKGQATLHLGGEDGPKQRVGAGDTIILPAGFGHKRLESTPDFIVVGGYPEEQDDIQIIRAGEEAARNAKSAIKATPIPASDPIYGSGGPVTRIWQMS
ncbi:MAG TPA: cupin [Hyphomicrobiales bacterium]|nr:cupin [Hyphomicrobiales bacterium]